MHKITINDDLAYLHIDFELRHTDSFPRRVHVYHGMLSELKKPTPIISVPIYLKPRQKAIPQEYKVEVGGYLFHQFIEISEFGEFTIKLLHRKSDN